MTTGKSTRLSMASFPHLQNRKKKYPKPQQLSQNNTINEVLWDHKTQSTNNW